MVVVEDVVVIADVVVDVDVAEVEGVSSTLEFARDTSCASVGCSCTITCSRMMGFVTTYLLTTTVCSLSCASTSASTLKIKATQPSTAGSHDRVKLPVRLGSGAGLSDRLSSLFPSSRPCVNACEVAL